MNSSVSDSLRSGGGSSISGVVQVGAFRFLVFSQQGCVLTIFRVYTDTCLRDVLLGEYNSDVVFFKQMAHHLVGLNEDSLVGFKNILLTRDPRDMLPSLAIQLPDATLADTGLANQVHLLNSILEHGEKPIVIDSSALLGNPESFLHSLCDRLDIKPDPSMLSWAAGPKPEDGVWAPFWYQNVHSSTGFDRGLSSRRTVPSNLVPVLDEAIGLFDRLIEFA